MLRSEHGKHPQAIKIYYIKIKSLHFYNVPQGMQADAKYLYLRLLGAEYTLKHLDYPPDSRVVLHVFEDCYTNTRCVGHKCFTTISLILVALIVVHLLE